MGSLRWRPIPQVNNTSAATGDDGIIYAMDQHVAGPCFECRHHRWDGTGRTVDATKAQMRFA